MSTVEWNKEYISIEFCLEFLYVENYKRKEEQNFWEYIFESKISQSKFQIFVSSHLMGKILMM
jgi:hypothetical protein